MFEGDWSELDAVAGRRKCGVRAVDRLPADLAGPVDVELSHPIETIPTGSSPARSR